MADLNKLRQVNPHWKPSESYQGIANIHKADEHDGDIHQEDLDKAGAEGSKKFWPEEMKKKEMNPSKYTKDDIEHAKTAIAEKIIKHFDDTLFEMICDEMGRRYVFQHENYLTEAGYDVFEDEWFEFFHEHHGDILFKVKQNITN